MIPLHPEFITKNGKKEFAVIPYEEFEALQELIADMSRIWINSQFPQFSS